MVTYERYPYWLLFKTDKPFGISTLDLSLFKYAFSKCYFCTFPLCGVFFM